MAKGIYFKGTAKNCTLIRSKQTEAQESRIERFKKNGKQQLTEDGRSTEITIDLVLQARAKLSDNKVNGPEDAIVSEMIKRLPMEKNHIIARCFQERFLGLMESRSSWKIVELFFFEETGRCPEERNHKQQSNTSVISKWCASCVFLRLEKEKRA